ncbi:transporter [Desulfobacterota bacterium AH_259_B03_O07]|nr:transporter [Desulfobacterota bacterium AH_259_B03_O07]
MSMNEMFKKCFVALSILVLFVSSIVPTNSVLAAPINSNVALPVRKGGFVFRSQVKWLRATDDPTSLNREVNVVAIPNVLVYGATPDLALFAIFPYIFRNVELTDPSTGKRIDKNDNGIGDLTLIARYTVYARDYPSGTARLAPLAGIKLPTGDDELEPITTDSVNLQLGGVSTVTWDFGRHEVDADLIYRINTEAENFEMGDDLVYDLAYEFRVYPWTLPDVGVPNFLYLVAEANGIFSQKDKLHGKTIDDSGGNILFLSPGIQLATKRFILEASIQLPVIQDLNGNQVETDFVLTGGFRVNLP